MIKPNHYMKAFFQLTLYLFLYGSITTLYAQDSLKIYHVAEVMPRFPGCEHLDTTEKGKTHCANNKMIKFISQNINYPESALAQGIEGSVYIQFIVDTSGRLVDEELVRIPAGGHTLGEEALRIFRLMQDEKLAWNPGRQRGSKVPVKFTLPIRFKLNNSNSDEIPLTPPKPAKPMDYETYEYAYIPSCKDEEGNVAKRTCTSEYLENFFYNQLTKKQVKADGVNKKDHYLGLMFLINSEGQIIDFKIQEGDQFEGCIWGIDSAISNPTNKEALTLEPFKGDGKAVRGVYGIRLDLLKVTKKK